MQPEFKNGFIAGGVIAISLCIDELYPNNQSIAMIMNIIIFAAVGLGIYYAMKEKRENNPKEFPFAKALLTGVFAVAYMACIAGIYSFSYAKFVNPDKGKQVLEQKMRDWKDKGILATAPPDSLENQKQIIATTYSPTGQLQSTVGVLVILGMFIVCIMAFIMKRNN